MSGRDIEPWTLAAAAALLGLPSLFRSSARARTALLFAVLFTWGAAAQLALNARLQSDGFYYFSYLRSIAFDRDVDFANDYQLLGLGDKPHLFVPTPTGHAQSAWTIGPAIVWSPFFAAGHVVAWQLARANPDVSANGISFPYRQAVCIGGLVYGLLGCWFCFRIAALFYSRRLAAAATVTLVAGSFMLWYIVKEPSMTHAPSMAAVAGFTWLWLATRERRMAVPRASLPLWVALGTLAGFMTLLRWQNVLFAIMPACDALVVLWRGARTGDRSLTRDTIVAGLLFTLCAAIAFVPQMLAWKAIYGNWLAVSPVGPQIRWADPHLADVLWSSRNGLLSFSPAVYLAAIGFLSFVAARPAVGVPLLFAAALMTYFNACIQDWWGSDGFGARRFDGLIPLLTLGLSAAISTLVQAVRRFPSAAALVAIAALAVWNLTLMGAAHSGRVRLGEAVSFGDAGATQARVLHGWIGMPTTYPASLLFAMRGGVSPGDYDLLSANRMLGDPARPYGRVDVGLADDLFVESGYHAAERDGATTFRWAAATASLRIPLDHSAPLRLRCRLRAFNYPGAPPQQVSLAINEWESQAVNVGADWQVVELDTPADAWRSGLNRVEVRFAREARPVDVGLGGDTRPLAGAVDYLRIEVIGAR